MSESTQHDGESAGGLELRVERLLPASPEDVFDAYTDSEKQKVWFSILDEPPCWR
jgi:uncharacterized protein YndB with AHSA1/START domain